MDVELVSDALVRFIRNQMSKTGLNLVIVGLSGGLDSTVSVYLAAKALGPGNVSGLIMPFRTSSPDSEADALSVADELGIAAHNIEISPIVDAFLKTARNADNIRIGNICARVRMILLFDQSKPNRAIVLGTGNKTEVLLGYFTLFGDSACSINPLGDLYKGQVYQLAEYLKVPRQIIDKEPTADLWPEQTDEGEMGITYYEVDRYFYYLVEKGMSPGELLDEGFDAAFQRNVIERVNANLFKAKVPIIARISGKTIKQPISLSELE
ncbi:MAG: NAD+ synthase [bacterium]|nr:NAD+ synthase [bacterium]